MEDVQIGFNSLTPLERLDKVLNIIEERGPLSLNEITHRELRLLKKITAKQADIEKVIDRLIDDKYIKIEPVDANYPNYKITFEGELFVQKGGYYQKQEDINLERDVLKTENDIAKRNSRISSIATLWAAVGAIGILGWEVLKTAYHNWDKIHPFLHNLFF